MLSPKGGGTRRTVGVSLAAFALIAGLVAASPALAGPDPLSSSSSVVLQLRNSHGLKWKPKSLTLPVNSGDLDPTTGAGTINTSKKVKAIRRGRKTKVKITVLVFGANGGPGRMDAKVGKHKVKSFGKLSGGTLTRDGFGAKLDGVVAKLGKKGAKALRQALSGGGKGKASAAAGGIKAGQPLGSASVTSVPQTVEVLPGGTLTFVTSLVSGGGGRPAFPFLLAAHCVNALAPGGVAAIPPAVQSGLVGEVFTFPVVGGSIAPDFSSGRVISAGGQTLTKNNDGSVDPPFGCSSPPPVGTTVIQTDWEAQFDVKALASNTVFPSGPVGIAALGFFDLSKATTSADPNTKQVTLTGAPVGMDVLSALVLNDVFPNEGPSAAFNFMGGDLLGTLSLNVTTH